MQYQDQQLQCLNHEITFSNSFCVPVILNNAKENLEIITEVLNIYTNNSVSSFEELGQRILQILLKSILVIIAKNKPKEMELVMCSEGSPAEC